MWDRDTSWVAEGAKVVIIYSGGWNSRIVGTSTIAKVGKRDIVLANGRRFRVSDLHEQGKDWTHADQIVRADDKRVTAIRAEQERLRLRSKVHEAVDGWVRNRESTERAREVVAAMTALIAFVEAEEDDEED